MPLELNTVVLLDQSFDGTFAPLQTVSAPSGRKTLDVTVDKLPKAYQAQLLALWQELTGTELTPTEVYIRLVLNNDQKWQLYGPALYAESRTNDAGEKYPNQLVIRLGNVYVPLWIIRIPNKKSGAVVSLTPEYDINQSDRIELRFTTEQIGGFKEVCLGINAREIEGYDELILPVGIRRVEYETKMDDTAFNRLLDRLSDDEQIKLFVELFKPLNSTQLEKLDNFSDLPYDVDLKIISIEPRNTKYGGNWIITIAADEDLGLTRNMRLWAFGRMKNAFSAGGYITEDRPGILNFNVTKTDKGKNSYNISKLEILWPSGDDKLDLEALTSSWT